ncbi:hypothetical protein [Pontibacter cellulosilyticus]|uniref:Uncharacterized protein n=1 Tax=Pontibacter cellulosilyticus TaxID=1720253 RepID=A0A923N8N6_9BACT|nr:hypothetical protein [Pontibacter cellulosilyticus]MBC5994843.1 hypothetical protein [Pontibacter cellulosilyticus]
MLLRLLKIVFGLLILLAVAVGLASISHPIILKWVTGSAKHHGKPMPATVYTNGQVNDHIKVFYSDEPKNYLLSFAEYDSLGMIKFLNVDLNEKRIGRPVATSKNDFDIIAGHLFQSETGRHFSPLQDDIKGVDFDSHLTFSDTEIKFNMPPNKLKFDSIRIELQ